MMKKMVAWLLLLAVLLCTAGVSLAESSDDSTVSFTPTLANLAGMTASESMASSKQRALISVLLAVDYMSANTNGDSYSPDLAKASYVGKKDLMVVVYLHAPAKDILLLYQPISKEAAYFYVDTNVDTIAEILLRSTCTDGYYKNDIEDIYTILQDLSNAINS